MIGKLLCKLGLHKGYPEKVGDWMTFYCVRCEKHTDPTSPERTEDITRQLYEDDGYDYDTIHGTDQEDP